MSWVDFIGYLASILVVLTFYMDKMVALRITAVLSNIAFLAYGISLELGPVVVLHGILLPLNIWRLRQLRRTRALSDWKTPLHTAEAIVLVREQGFRSSSRESRQT